MRSVIGNHCLQVKLYRRSVSLNGDASPRCCSLVLGSIVMILLEWQMCLQVILVTPWPLDVVPGVSIIWSGLVMLVNRNSQGMPINDGGSLSRQYFFITNPCRAINGWLLAMDIPISKCQQCALREW